MIRNLLATTAVATLLATGAMAQESTQPAPAMPAQNETMPADTMKAPAAVQPASGHLATNLIGENVYNGTGDQAQNIGDVNDIVISNEGMVEAVVVGVGGFLGIGEKNVAVDYKQMNWAEQNGDRWLVMETTKEALESLPNFDRSAYEPAAPATATDTTTPAPADQTATAPATPVAPADQAAQAPAPADQTAQAPAPADQNATETDTMKTGAIDKSTLNPFDTSNVRAEDLIGTTVYGAEDANVGEIGDVVMTPDGKVDAIIIDVGGFLGVGEKEVAVGMDKLAFLTDKDGNKYLYTAFTKEQLDAAAAYDKSSWAEKRDEQRLMVQ
ncbi:PRC-barrel domain-containing protein [Arvimicrobium flavum]|uniref:PRC-barrel domain-containing protein n=1 Tax=Arvimicrobium flavum TaxID=3393320 RepID=UPI00237A8DDC|nr:PRC-barrel domain-containing protein [Mesorhizobium shangrilense]